MEKRLLIIVILLAWICYFLYKLFILLEKKERERNVRIENYLYKLYEELYKISYLSETTDYKKLSKTEKENISIRAWTERNLFKDDVEEYIEKKVF